jgi:hypothetical protein
MGKAECSSLIQHKRSILAMAVPKVSTCTVDKDSEVEYISPTVDACSNDIVFVQKVPESVEYRHILPVSHSDFFFIYDLLLFTIADDPVIIIASPAIPDGMHGPRK